MEKCGKAKSFTCPYHGWTFGANGTLLDQNAKTGYPPRFNAQGTYNLRQVPRLERYRGFWFMNMNPKAVPLEISCGNEGSGSI
jgi:p-cumate 2,3-dioxygenase alpha subunit